jgi:LysR family transcriptional regulator, low CO2-responsive transcriptional regulator
MPLDTRIPLSKLEIYCTVVELESVTAAAKELFVSQPVVTSHVRSLQDRLGAKLLYRDGHSMRPTEAGQLAYEWAKDVLTRSHEMSRRIEGLADGSVGSVAVAASMTVGSYLLPPVVTRFREGRPLARIGLDMFDPEHVVSGIESGAYDIGVLIANQRSLKSGDLVFERIGHEEFVLVAGPGADVPDVIEAAALPELEMVGSPRHRAREYLLTDLLDGAGLERGPTAIELGHAEAMKRVVKESGSLSFMFEASVRDELARGELRRVEIAGVGPLGTPIYLAHRDRKDFSALQAALVEAIKADLA